MATDVRTEHPYIVRRKGAGGERAVIAGTNLAVWFLVRQVRAGDTPEKIVEAYSYPGLTLASIYDAMSYYHDHRAEIDPIIAHGDDAASQHEVQPATDAPRR